MTGNISMLLAVAHTFIILDNLIPAFSEQQGQARFLIRSSVASVDRQI